VNNLSGDLENKIAIVTGGTKGIGYGMALGLARAGAHVAVVSRTKPECERVSMEIKQLGRQSLAISADVSKVDSVYEMVARVVEKFGRVDILVNNAGVSFSKPAVEISEEEWDYILNINLKGLFFCAQAAGKQMIKQKRGKIINVASILGLVGEYFVSPYCAAKGGVVQLTRALALEWSPYNIQVNAIAPGYVLTNLNKAELSNEKIYKYIIKKTPQRRLGKVEDMVGLTVFLASNSSDYITGQVIPVDGGWTAQ